MVENISSSYGDGYYGYYDYFYNYSYPEAVDHLPLEEFVPVAVVFCGIGLAGLVGNLLVIFAVAKLPRMRNITNLFLLSLACADLLLVVVCVPVKCIAFFSYTWRLGKFMCKFVNYIQTVSMICSASTLTAMSVERFFAIRYPLRARSLCTIRHARMVILFVWYLAFMGAIPIIFGIEYKEVGVRTTAYWCHKIWTEKRLFGQVYELYMLLMILVIPVTVMLATYTCISVTIWHVASRRADMRSGSCAANDSGEKTVSINQNPPVHITYVSANKQSKAYMDDDRTRKQVVLMLMVVVALFALCWTPVLVNNVLVAFDLLDYLSEGYLKPMRIAFHLLSYANSCVNPFVYAFMSKNFRDGFSHAICACVRGDAYIRKQMSARSVTSTTRASTSNSSGEKANGLRSDSITVRRPSDMEEMEMRRLY